MLDEITKEIDVSDEVLKSMPLTTDKNKKKYSETLDEEISKFKFKRDEIYKELKKRISSYDNLTYRNYDDVRDSLKNFSKALAFATDLNTPYEKLKLDKIIYDLSCFEDNEDNLNNLNKNIFKAIKIFELAGIKLSSSDFNYTGYVHQYMDVFFKYQSNLDNDNLKKCFNSIYWQCPELIIQLELNIRYLYLKNKKVFEKYIVNFNQKLLSSFNDGEDSLVKDYAYLRNKIETLFDDDKENLIYDFYHENLNIDDYTDEKMKGIIDKYFSSSDEKCFNNLLCSLKEYKDYKKFLNLIDKIRQLYKEDLEKGFLDKRLKQISKLESKLFGLVKKSDKRLSLTKVDKYEPQINDLINQIKIIYDEIDKNILKVKIKEHLKDNSTIFKGLLLIYRNYSIGVNVLKELNNGLTYDELNNMLDELAQFVLNPKNTIITNFTFLEEISIESVIVSNYRLFNVNIDEGSLNDFEGMISDLEKIKNYYNLKRFNISISELCNVKKIKLIVSKYENL